MSKAKLFTVILDLDGGTYISQVRSDTLQGAVNTWARRLVNERIPRLGPATARAVADKLRSARQNALSGLTNVWCTGCIVRNRSLLINVVMTEPGPA